MRIAFISELFVSPDVGFASNGNCLSSFHLSHSRQGELFNSFLSVGIGLVERQLRVKAGIELEDVEIYFVCNLDGNSLGHRKPLILL